MSCLLPNAYCAPRDQDLAPHRLEDQTCSNSSLIQLVHHSLISSCLDQLSRALVKIGFGLIIYMFYNKFIRFTHRCWICSGWNIHNAFVSCRFHRFVDLLGKPAFKPGLLFLRKGNLFSNLSFFRVFGRTLIPECAYRP